MIDHSFAASFGIALAVSTPAGFPPIHKAEPSTESSTVIPGIEASSSEQFIHTIPAGKAFKIELNGESATLISPPKDIDNLASKAATVGVPAKPFPKAGTPPDQISKQLPLPEAGEPQPPLPTTRPPLNSDPPVGASNPNLATEQTPTSRNATRDARIEINPPAALPGNGDTRLLFPLSSAAPIPVSSGFGWRIHPITNTLRFHAGVDFAAPLGTPVVAAYSGQVVTGGWLGGYGLTVVIRSENGQLQTLYGHLSELFVKPGDQVEQGEVVGRVGSTGNSTGPHLHFEVQVATVQGYQAIDPIALLNATISTSTAIAADVVQESPDTIPLPPQPAQSQQPQTRNQTTARSSHRKTAPIKSSSKATPLLISHKQELIATSSLPLDRAPIFSQAVLAAVASDRLHRKTRMRVRMPQVLVN